jgi:hypothetical protein
LSKIAQQLTIGANGVILITTKTGKRIQSQESVSILIQVFRKQQSRFVECQNALLLNESYANGGNSVPFLM